MRRREQERPPRPPLPEQLWHFDPLDYGCIDDWPSSAWQEAHDKHRAAMDAWCEKYGTNPLELLRERQAAARAANPDHYAHVHNRRNPA